MCMSQVINVNSCISQGYAVGIKLFKLSIADASYYFQNESIYLLMMPNDLLDFDWKSIQHRGISKSVDCHRKSKKQNLAQEQFYSFISLLV